MHNSRTRSRPFMPKGVDAVKVAILDGVLYIRGRRGMFESLNGSLTDENIFFSCLLHLALC
jgi:hypothetical protein